jgi:hypothetical protein
LATRSTARCVKIGVLAAGRQPRAADQADTLATLVGMYRQWINNGTFGRLRDVIPLQSFTAQPNTHVYRNSLAVTTISLPELVVGCPQVWCCEIVGAGLTASIRTRLRRMGGSRPLRAMLPWSSSPMARRKQRQSSCMMATRKEWRSVTTSR